MQSSFSEEIRRYPYFMQPVIDALDRPGADQLTRARLKQRLAVNISSSSALRELLALDSESLSDFYGEGPDTPSTLDTIDSFLTHFCQPAAAAPTPELWPEQSEAPQSIPAAAAAVTKTAAPLQETPAADQTPAERYDPATQLPPAPAVDFLAELEESYPAEDAEQTPEDSTSSCIDAFLKAQPPKRPRPRRPLTSLLDPAIPAEEPEAAPTPAPEPYHEPGTDDIVDDALDADVTPEKAASASSSSTLTEGFARILIKNGNFSKALEIITQLNLKNPEKSIYFADQIRFLRKLIANQEKS